MIRLMVLNISVMVVVLLAFAVDVMAGAITVTYSSPLHIQLSSNAINRVYFSGVRLNKIVGDTNKVSVILSDNGENLFVSSKVPPGEKANLSAIDIHGNVFDLVASFKETVDPILINIQTSKNFHMVKVLLDAEQKEVKLILDSMQAGIKGKYFLPKVNKKRLHLVDGCEFHEFMAYRWQDLTGMGLVLRNSSKQPITIDRKLILERFKGVVATNFQELIIGPGKKMKIFLVSKEEMPC